jgi:hypothetical protein
LVPLPASGDSCSANIICAPILSLTHTRAAMLCLR